MMRIVVLTLTLTLTYSLHSVHILITLYSYEVYQLMREWVDINLLIAQATTNITSTRSVALCSYSKAVYYYYYWSSKEYTNTTFSSLLSIYLPDSIMKRSMLRFPTLVWRD